MTLKTGLDRIRLDPQKVRKILVCQLRRIGDVLLATPSIRLLNKAFPRAEIHILTEKQSVPVLEHNPDLDRIWAIDKKRLNHLGKELVFYSKVARQGFDLLVDFQQLPRCRWVALLSMFFGTRVRLTYTPPWYNRLLFTHWSRPRDGYAAMSKASVLEPLGISWRGERPRLNILPREFKKAKKFLQDLGVSDNNTLVTVDPTHRRETRRWPAGYFGELIKMAAKARPDLKFLLLFGPGEKEIANQVLESAATPACLLSENMLSIREMAAVIACAHLHFGTCSAPRHIAVAVGTPSLVVLGSTSSAWTYPSQEHEDISLDIDCRPCNRNTCPDPKCLTGLTPEKVLPALLESLERNPKKPCASFS